MALIGAPNTTIGSSQGQGSVYVFRRIAGTWTQIQKLTADDGQPGDAFGISVALAGSTAINDWGMQKGILHSPLDADDVRARLARAGFRVESANTHGNCLDVVARKEVAAAPQEKG